MSKNFYLILGVPPDADIAQIRKAYKKLAKCHHPDAATGSQERFTEVQEAYDTLADKTLREQYDRRQKSASAPPGPRPSRATGACAAEELSPTNPNWPSPVTEQGTPSNRWNRFSRRQFRHPRSFREHPALTRDSSPGGMFQAKKQFLRVNLTRREANQGGTYLFEIPVSSPCNVCHGVGMTGWHRCLDCFGSGTISFAHRMKIRIPPGVRNGTRIHLNFSNQGEPDKEIIVQMDICD